MPSKPKWDGKELKGDQYSIRVPYGQGKDTKTLTIPLNPFVRLVGIGPFNTSCGSCAYYEHRFCNCHDAELKPDTPSCGRYTKEWRPTTT